MEQQYMLDPDMTIEQIVTEAIAKIGEKITVRRYTRYAMGEGLEKRQDNFAEEVMSQMG
jgi:elongation factor Ts